MSRSADSNGFRFTSSKTKVQHFTCLRGAVRHPDLSLYGKRLPFVKQSHYLGVIFDSRLTWLSTLRDVTVTCRKRLCLFRILSHVSRGAESTILLQLYQALIQPKLDYSSQLFDAATTDRLRILDAIHYGSTRQAKWAFRTCLLPILLVDARLLPLQQHRQPLITRLWYRCQSMPCNPALHDVCDTSLDEVFTHHPKLPQSFNFRSGKLKEELSLPQIL